MRILKSRSDHQSCASRESGSIADVIPVVMAPDDRLNCATIYIYFVLFQDGSCVFLDIDIPLELLELLVRG